jgi:hypothetical protein
MKKKDFCFVMLMITLCVKLEFNKEINKSSQICKSSKFGENVTSEFEVSSSNKNTLVYSSLKRKI